MPVISVVIPVYNGEHTILNTIASIQEQTFSNFEIIVIDDGSTDGTVERVNTVQDPRLKVFSYSNGGLPVARNRGISRSTGEFITFIDADDLWTSDKLELQLAALRQHPEAGLVYSWTASMDEKGENFYPGISASYEGNVYPQLLLTNFIASGSNAMLRRDVIDAVGEFDAELRSCEDWEYWLRVAARWPFAVVRKPQVLYRQTSGAMSSKVEVMEKYYLMVLERAFAAAPPELHYLKNQSLAYEGQFVALVCLNRQASAEGAKIACQRLQKAIRLHPKILLQKKTQSLLVKLLLISLLSPEIATFVLQKISKIRANKKPSVA